MISKYRISSLHILANPSSIYSRRYFGSILSHQKSTHEGNERLGKITTVCIAGIWNQSGQSIWNTSNSYLPISFLVGHSADLHTNLQPYILGTSSDGLVHNTSSIIGIPFRLENEASGVNCVRNHTTQIVHLISRRWLLVSHMTHLNISTISIGTGTSANVEYTFRSWTNSSLAARRGLTGKTLYPSSSRYFIT